MNSQAGTIKFSLTSDFHIKKIYVHGHLMLSTTPDFARLFFSQCWNSKENHFPNAETVVCKSAQKALLVPSRIISPNHMPFSFYLK